MYLLKFEPRPETGQITMNSKSVQGWGTSESMYYSSGSRLTTWILIVDADGFHVMSAAGQELHLFAHRMPWPSDLVVSRTRSDVTAEAHVRSKFVYFNRGEITGTYERNDTSLVCTAHGDSSEEQCESGNLLNDGYRYTSNLHRGTLTASCGPQASCACCRRPLLLSSFQDTGWVRSLAASEGGNSELHSDLAACSAGCVSFHLLCTRPGRVRPWTRTRHPGGAHSAWLSLDRGPVTRIDLEGDADTWSWSRQAWLPASCGAHTLEVSIRSASPGGIKFKSLWLEADASAHCLVLPALNHGSARDLVVLDELGDYAESLREPTNCPPPELTTIWLDRSSAPFTCVAGSISNSSDGSSPCTLCAAGSFGTAAGATSCNPCPPGTYSARAGSITCTPCPHGSSSPSASSSVAACACIGGFTALTANSTRCTACVHGKHQPGNSSYSTAPFARWLMPGCSRTSAGRLPVLTDAELPLGYVVCCKREFEVAGKGCHSGHGDNSTRGVGFWEAQRLCTGQGWRLCRKEELAHWNSSGACASGCDSYVWAEYDAQLWQAQQCNDCPPGSFSESNGSAFCSRCPRGKYSTATAATNASTCKDCPQHTSSGLGSGGLTNCTCNAGHTGPDGGECTACIGGTYKDVNGSSPCTLCSPGKYSMETGKISESTCDDCLAHTHSPAGSASVMSCICNQGYTPAHAFATGVVLRDGDTDEINFADVDVACADISAHKAHITCCDDDGVCHRFSPGMTDHTGSTICYSKSNAVSFETAVVTCFLQGMRLCTTQAELQTCDGTGCGHDKKQIWTAPLGACGISGVCVHACTCACAKHAHGIT